MNLLMRLPTRRRLLGGGGGLGLGAVLAAVLLLAPAARADLIVSVQNVNATAGTTGNTIEVLLTNTDAVPTVSNIAGFSFKVSVPGGSGITFTASDDMTTTPYVFAGNSLGFLFNTVYPSTMADGNDLANVPMPLAANATVALGRLTFDVAANASGMVVVDLLDFPDTSVANETQDLDVNLQDGSITIQPGGGGNVVPEPGTLALLGVGLLGAAARWRRRSR